MPTENKITEPVRSLATASTLDADTWADFVQRLRHDCVGAGVRDHCTSCAIFIVQKRTTIYGLDMDYAEEKVVICDETEWRTPKEYWEDLDEDGRADLNREAQAWCEHQFMKADEDDQWEILEKRENHYVTGIRDEWEYVNAHFTKDAAEAFIRRKKHDYRKGMRVYVDSQYYAWEFNAIKEAILDGTLTYMPKEAA
ncbi:hypothetical protein ACYZTM_01860 [Pseudomonas sp. MDT2-39-1]